MSLEAMVWAWRQDVGNPVRKLILLHYANAANPENNFEAWHAAGRIAEACNCSKGSVLTHVKDLVDMGYLTVVRKSTGFHSTTRYRLNVGKVSVENGPLERSAPERERSAPERERSAPERERSAPERERSGGITKTVIETVIEPVIEPSTRILLSKDKQIHALLNQIAEQYNQLCTGHTPTKSPQPIHHGRMAAVREIIRSHPEFADVGIWEWFWSGIDALPFWNGKPNPENGKRFKRGIDYFLTYENFSRLLDEVEALEPTDDG